MEAAAGEYRREMVTRSDGHPLHYLNCLNELFSYGENMQQSTCQGRSESRLKKIKIPAVFLQTFQLQRHNLESGKQRKQQSTVESDSNWRLWKEHNEIVKKYCGRRTEKSRADRTYTYSKEDQQRILSVDPKNVFLRKLIKAGKIPNYDRQQLQNEVIDKLRGLSMQKGNTSAENTVSRLYCRSASKLRRPKTSVPMTSQLNAAYKLQAQRQAATAKNSIRGNRRSMQRQDNLQEELESILGSNYQQDRAFEDLGEQFKKKASVFRKIDSSMSCSTMNKIRSFIVKIRDAQNNI